MKLGRKKLILGSPNGKGAQVSLELAASLVVVFVLLFGALQVFLWVNKRIVQRQKHYEAKRVEAANSPAEVQVDEADQAKYPKLKVFGQ